MDNIQTNDIAWQSPTNASDAVAYDFSISPHLEINTIYVGHEQQPIIIVDNLLQYPDTIIRYAEAGCAFKKDTKDFYPGIRKALSSSYAEQVYRHLRESLCAVFTSKPSINIKLQASVLSLTTTAPHELRPIQSVPHFDSLLGNTVASIHYFCGAEFGGTSFYRHRKTEFESISAQRVQTYLPLLKSEVMRENKISYTYIDGDTDFFERTAEVAAKFNRAIFYRSNMLHSGNIKTTSALNEHPKHGRLTANTLITIE